LPSRELALTQIGNYDSYAFTTPQDNPHLVQAAEVAQTIVDQQATVVQSVYVFGGEKFPRGNISVQIGSAIVSGHFGNNSVFYIDGGSGSIAQHPAAKDFNWWGNLYGYYRRLYDFAGDGAVGLKKMPYATGFYVTSLGVTFFVPDGNVVGDNAGYVYVEPGASVKMASAEPQQYVVSITPGTVLRVVAWTTKDGQRFIQDVPTNWYSVRVEQFGIFPVTIITLTDALSKNEQLGFEDDLYVTFQSTIGPNTVDILVYIIETFSDFEIDTATFDHVRTRLQNYPSHFAIYDKKNIVNVLQEIAWQACCAIYLKNGKFYLIYLPEQPVPADTITKNHVIFNSFELGHTSSEELVTKMVCEWTASGIQESPFTTILRHNVKKYGVRESSYDYYIYDFADAVVKSATFWLIRYSNTWKKARFNLPLTKMNLETFDFVTLDLNGIISTTPAICMIEVASYNSNSNTLIVDCWCPVKAGTMETYDFAHPADQLTTSTFPTDYEIQEGFDGGNGPGKSVTKRITWEWGVSGAGTNWPDEENEYEQSDPYDQEDASGDTDDDRRRNDRGNPNPSDVGDVSPGEKVIREGSTIEASSPGPASGNQGGNPIPEPSGYGGPTRYPGGPTTSGPDVSGGCVDDLEP